MKYLNTYKLFESIDNQFFKTYEETKNWLDIMNIRKYIINGDLKVDVNTNVRISQSVYLKYFPIQFGIVKGHFRCSDNELISLKGSPIEIFGSFDCSNNNLTSLKGCTPLVENFYCYRNKLTNFEGCPEFISDFNCSYNPVYEIYDMFLNKDCIKWINEYNVIKDNKIILENFKEVLYMMDIQDFDFNQLSNLENYKVI